MNWKFWMKNKPLESGAPKQSLPKPREIPEIVGRHLVVGMKKDPDFAWKLMAVVRPRAGSKSAFDVRVYSPVEAGIRGLNVKNYDTFNAVPDLILFEGWYDKATNTAELVDRSTEALKAAV